MKELCMTKILPIKTEDALTKLFTHKPIIKNSKPIEMSIEEMAAFNTRMLQVQNSFRSKTAASLMAVHDFFYNA